MDHPDGPRPQAFAPWFAHAGQVDNFSDTRRTPPGSVSLVLNPASPGSVVALTPDGRYQAVENWTEVILLLDADRGYQAVLAIDPKQAEQVAEILNGQG
jgi:hypothetical protein